MQDAKHNGCGGNCSCGDKGKEKKADLVSFLSDLSKKLTDGAYTSEFEPIFDKHNVTLELLLDMSNKLDSIMSFLFGDTNVVFSCYDESWYINHEGFIVVNDIAPEGQELLFIVENYVGRIADQAIFQVSVYAKDLAFHGVKGGLIVKEANYLEEFDESKVMSKLMIVHDKETLDWIMKYGGLQKGAKVCKYCGSIATAHTEKGWYCESCNDILSILKIK